MSARIFIMPRCALPGAPHDALNDTLERAGYDMGRTVGFTHKPEKVIELVTRTALHEDGAYTYQRGDGFEFRHPPAPKAA